jgi:hypothetical protein
MTPVPKAMRSMVAGSSNLNIKKEVEKETFPSGDS